jgi:hypothetical protein
VPRSRQGPTDSARPKGLEFNAPDRIAACLLDDRSLSIEAMPARAPPTRSPPKSVGRASVVNNASSTPKGRRVRLLQVVPSLAIGGLERVVQTLTRTVDRERFQVAVACLREKGPFADGLESEGFEVHLTGPNHGRPSRWGFRALRRLVREWGPDVVHTHNTGAFLDGAMASVWSGVTTLVHTDHARDFPTSCDTWPQSGSPPR